MAEGSPGEIIGRNIRAVREAQLLSRTELAERSGVSKAGIDNLERGLSARPRRRTIEKLARALAVPVEHLMGQEPTSPKVAPPPSQPSLNGLLQEERRGQIPGVLADYMKQRASERDRQAHDPASPHFRTAADAKVWIEEVSDELLTWSRWLFRHATTLLPPAEDAANREYWRAILDFAIEAGPVEFQSAFDHAQRRIEAMEDAPDELRDWRIMRKAIAEVEAEAEAEASTRRREAAGGLE